MTGSRGSRGSAARGVAGVGAGADAGLALHAVSVELGRRPVLHDVSFGAAAGAVTAVIGPNGAGKSTLLGVAAGHVRMAAGEVRLGGRDLERIPVREAARLRAVMPQDATVAFPFTVREVVALGRTPWQADPLRDPHIVAESIGRVGLEHLADREVTTLSGGERQLAALARVITQATPVGPGSVILLDEPTSAMDIAHAEATLALTRELAVAGAAVVMVLHDLDAAAAYADHLVLMDQGRVRAAGDVADVCDADLLSEVYGTPVEVYAHAGRLRVAPLRAAARLR